MSKTRHGSHPLAGYKYCDSCHGEGVMREIVVSKPPARRLAISPKLKKAGKVAAAWLLTPVTVIAASLLARLAVFVLSFLDSCFKFCMDFVWEYGPMSQDSVRIMVLFFCTMGLIGHILAAIMYTEKVCSYVDET